MDLYDREPYVSLFEPHFLRFVMLQAGGIHGHEAQSSVFSSL